MEQGSKPIDIKNLNSFIIDSGKAKKGSYFKFIYILLFLIILLIFICT